MTGFAVLVALGSLAAAALAAAALRALPTLRLQLAGLAVLAVAVPLAAVLLSGMVMFHMGDDIKILAVSAAAASAALVVALILAHGTADAVDRIRDSSLAVAAGDLTVRAPEAGPAELAQLAAAFNEMTNSLQELFDARRELVAWASHDLRTPLANMQAILEAVEDEVATPAEYLPALRDQVRSLAGLVDDLFELSQIDQGVLTFELRDAPIGALVGACLGGVEAEARAKHISLEARLEQEVVVRCAPDKIERVLFNLLTNALRHTPADGAIAVIVSPDDDEVVVAVEDTGNGLSAESLRRMFERFWRDDPARSARGAGLGLAIAQALVEAHGGRIWAENRPHGGARIAFTLPAS